jgi:dTDP-4-dehydro-2,3,6-trideoxy-D-glucose 4-aminotransferase
MINLCQPQTGEAELAAIEGVFASNWLGVGPRVEEFERSFARYIGKPATEVLAVTSCTEGLFQAVAALDLGPGDEVVLPTVSFLGAAHAVRHSGARVVFCDVDPITLNPTAEQIEAATTPATKAALVLHYGGRPGSVAEIAELLESRSLLLIEDSACALGSFLDGQACGTFGDVGVWSFDAMKLMTTGDGGMVWSRDPEVAERIRRSIRMGVGSSGFDRRGDSSRWWEIDPQGTGRRATMNDVSAAMGLVQLQRVPDFLGRRREVAAAYDAALVELPWMSTPGRGKPDWAPYYYWIHTAPGVRDRLATHLLECGVYTNFRYWPLHKTPMYGSGEALPGADLAAESTLLLPVHQGLSDSDVTRVIEATRAFHPELSK